MGKGGEWSLEYEAQQNSTKFSDVVCSFFSCSNFSTILSSPSSSSTSASFIISRFLKLSSWRQPLFSSSPSWACWRPVWSLSWPGPCRRWARAGPPCSWSRRPWSWTPAPRWSRSSRRSPGRGFPADRRIPARQESQRERRSSCAALVISFYEPFLASKAVSCQVFLCE